MAQSLVVYYSRKGENYMPGGIQVLEKGHTEYAAEHIAWICDKLMRIPDITVCPHGRPVAMTLSRANLDRQFKRS